VPAPRWSPAWRRGARGGGGAEEEGAWSALEGVSFIVEELTPTFRTSLDVFQAYLTARLFTLSQHQDMADYQPEPEGSRSLVQSTQPFDDDDESYKARLASALGHHARSTQAFDSQDLAYKARLQAALGQQPHADPDPNPDRPSTDAAAHVPAPTRAEAADALTQQTPQEPQPVNGLEWALATQCLRVGLVHELDCN
jgi:hypothetical protein